MYAKHQKFVVLKKANAQTWPGKGAKPGRHAEEPEEWLRKKGQEAGILHSLVLLLGFAKDSAVPVTGWGTYKSLSTWTEIVRDEKSVRSRCNDWKCCFTFIIFIFLTVKEKVLTFSSLNLVRQKA